MHRLEFYLARTYQIRAGKSGWSVSHRGSMLAGHEPLQTSAEAALAPTWLAAIGLVGCGSLSNLLAEGLTVTGSQQT